MINRLRKNKTILIWSVIPVLIALELVQQWRIPRMEPSPKDWQDAVRAVAAEKKAGDLVIIAPDWAVQGRTYFKNLISWKDFGRFDTTVYQRIFQVSMNGETAPETRGLHAEQIHRYGNLTVSRFPLAPPDRVLYDFTDNLSRATVTKFVDKRPKIIIDHWFHPRRITGIRLIGKSTLEYNDVPLSGVLRGYGIIDYREGRYNKGEPAQIDIFVNDRKIARERIANFGPLEPFEVELPGSGRGTVRFEFSATGNTRRELGLAADVRVQGAL